MPTLRETIRLWAGEFDLDAGEMQACAERDALGGEHTGWPGGSIWDVEGRLLYALIRTAGVERVLEFGTGHGCATSHIAKALYDNGRGVVVTLDRPDSIDLASYRVPEPYAVHVVRILEDGLTWVGRLRRAQPSRLSACDLPEPACADRRSQSGAQAGNGVEFDLVFEDGPHTYEFTREAIGLSLPHLKPGGFVLVHDVYGPHENNVWPGLRAVLPDARRIRIEPSRCGLGYWRKPLG